MGNLRSGLPGFYHWPDRNASIGFRTELARGGDPLHLFWLIPITTASSSGEEWEDVADTVPARRQEFSMLARVVVGLDLDRRQ